MSYAVKELGSRMEKFEEIFEQVDRKMKEHCDVVTQVQKEMGDLVDRVKVLKVPSIKRRGVEGIIFFFMGLKRKKMKIVLRQ